MTQIQVKECGRLTFYITEHRIGLETGFQFFSIQGVNQYCTKQVKYVRRQIEAGNITTLLEFYEASEGKVMLKYSRKTWFYDTVERLDSKQLAKPVAVVIVVPEPSMAILLEPEATETTPLLTTLMAVEV